MANETTKNGIPKDYHTVTPYLMVRDADKLINFLKKAFDAKERSCHRLPDGAIMNAEVRIGDSMVMLGQARGEYAPVESVLYLYVPEVDALYARALKAGGTSIQEPGDMFYGDRNAGVKDPSGNRWYIATRKEDLSPEEMERRTAAFLKGNGGVGSRE